MLTRSGVVAGERVLVTGASGGVGSATMQFAKKRGAHVIALASPFKAPRLMEIGAAETISWDDDYVDLLGANSVDVVVDLVAGPQWSQLLDVLQPEADTRLQVELADVCGIISERLTPRI